jgi:RNAse (barnase) inhibitor barstar
MLFRQNTGLDSGLTRTPVFAAKQQVWRWPQPLQPDLEAARRSDTEPFAEMDMPLRTVKSNIVQSIRAFRVSDLQDAARELGHHFLYANLAQAHSKQDVLDLIAQQFTFPGQTSKNFDALYDGMTDPLHKSGQQPGFIVVLEHIPAHAKFDKEAREQLLDVFREASDFWSDRKVPFRCFYSFSVARAPAANVVERPETTPDAQGIDLGEGEKMPTDKLVDISPLALRMSSPFNAGYWLAAA